MADKIFNQLPVVLQTKAIKNFFEATVEQLYSEANIEPINGFIGKKTGDEAELSGAFIEENTADRKQYNLVPAVNNLNPLSGDSENLMFYDEFIDTLNVYGVTTTDHNKIFGSRYRSFMPPIDIDKFVNYQEYYWYPDGPAAKTIEVTLDNPINIDVDVIGKKTFSYGTTVFRNGMIVVFSDNQNVIPTGASTTATFKAGVEYIVGGVGESIYLVEKQLTSSTLYGGSRVSNKDYLVIERGSANNNAWSRVNHWYHRDNFLEADSPLPSRIYRAMRPILEFDRNLEMYNQGDSNYGIATVAAVAATKADIEGQSSLTIDTRVLQNNDIIFFPNEEEDARVYLYKVSGAGSSITLTATSETPIAENQTVVIAKGNVFEGADYLYDGEKFAQGQKKVQINQTPLFKLYDDAGNSLDNNGLYPNSTFAGSGIFTYKVGTGAADTELGFPLTYTPYKAVSEITFDNAIQSERVEYRPYGSHSNSSVLGSYYYKLLKTVPEYHSYWKLSGDKNEQKIITTHYITRDEVDDETLIYNIGAVPNTSTITSSGYEILVKVNGAIVTDYAYEAPSSIKFNSFTFSKGDVIDVEVTSDSGITKISDSRYDIPLSWKSNPFNSEIEIIAEPQYLSHFKNYIEKQEGFVGDPLSSNNFSNTAKDIQHARDIVQTDQDTILAAFLLDDQPHNIIDSLRFSAREYEKYRARLIKEIGNYYNNFPTDNLTKEYILEKVLRSLISYSVGKNVFGSTYVLPFGDNYKEEIFDVGDLTNTTYVMSNYADLETIENSLLVYYTNRINNIQELMTVGVDYTLSSLNPITIAVTKTMELGDTITAKLYNEDRDSAECPATPSTMGIYPLFTPGIETDDSFITSQQLLVGHDGSKTALTGTVVDDVLLEFEKRVYNTSLQTLRQNNSYPRLNVGDVRAGAFRSNNFSPREYNDLLRNSFTNWTGANNVDHVTNEFFDSTDQFTWNYRGNKDLPGHWRGWYEYYYDTVRPHTHPWEMLGFLDKPTWWETQYGTDYGSNNFDMWEDLEQGIIRQGDRGNFANKEYLKDNNWRRIGLSNVLPVNAEGTRLSPGSITSTGSTSRVENWNNRRLSTQDVTDTFTDVAGENNLPNGITLTYGDSSAARVLFDANAAPQAGTFWDYDGTISSTVVGSGFQEGMDGFTTPYVFVKNSITNKTFQIYNYSINNLSKTSGIIVKRSALTANTTIGVTVTGKPILNPTSLESWNDEGEWYTTNTFRGETSEDGVYFITPKEAGLEEWDTTSHSPIVGWSFDGLPIYGPYGYTSYHANGSVNDNTITNIKSNFKLRAGNRPDGPGGDFTGEFVQDYTYNPTDAATYAGETGTPQDGTLGEFNMRYGVTPDSNGEKIYFYVATIDDNGNPMFPYCIGGTEEATNTFESRYWANPVEPVKNNNGTITDDGTVVAVSSSQFVTASDDGTTGNVWRFGDGAPAENAWKYSCGYPFAVAEAMFLSRPGKFVTSFSDPLRITSPVLDKYKIINKASRKPFSFTDPDHFCIHGSIDSAGDAVKNIGYTQFVHSWLTYQDLNTTTDYADKLRKINIKLAHRLAGFTDKDTLTVRADQTSLTTTTQSLIIPVENTDVVVHSSPYKNRNFYSGMSIQKTEKGYKLRGYDKNFGYFNILRRNKVGQSTNVEVGGEAADYTDWQPQTAYPKETIVKYNNGFYKAPTLVPSSETFINSLWSRLPSLPQNNAVKATVFLEDLPYIDRVDYQTEYQSYQEVVDVIVGLGAYQESLGFDFGGFDNSINDVRNWNYVVRQFLFFVAGGWETNNTLELSPLANRVSFTSTSGMIAGINRTDKNQFTLIDQDGRAIQPSECEIVREGNSIEIVPPAGIQIYGTLLFTKEIEHALIFDNVTDFNDVLFDPIYNQAQKRLKVKGKRTANWSGLFSSEGFIIQNDELKPNLDNMAQSLGRYHELGFIPVEKQIYEQARGLFGYQERAYLNDLEIEDDDQFEFYKGMLQSKGTGPSLEKISKSSNIVSGEMNIYDEWALKVGDFGDLENEQSIELKLEKSDIINDPQLITLAFPEDTTGVIDYVKLIDLKHKYHSAPTVEIAAPSGKPAVQATARAELEANGVLKAIHVTNTGSGYSQPVRLTVVAGNTSVANVNTVFNTPVATSTVAVPDANINSLGSLTITNFDGMSTSTIDLNGATEMANVVTAINNDISINEHATASFITNPNNTTVLSIAGPDLTLSGTALANLNILAGRYQPKQRYNIASVDNHPTKGTGATTVDDITVTVNNSVVQSTHWDYDAGSRQAIPFNIGTSGAIDVDNGFVNSGDVIVPLATILDANNIVKENNLTYSHANVFVNGVELINIVGEQKYTLTTNQVTIHNVETLPGSRLQEGANIYVIENPTVDFKDNFMADLPDASLNIKVATSDDIAIITKSKRLFDITPDVKGDDTILIDIDDSKRFLKKPIGVREQNLWPTTSALDYKGITDSRFTHIPNAGYIDSANVDYSAFDIGSIPDLFRPEFLIQPDTNSTLHVAVSENREWNVYKFKEANTNISFVEMEDTDATAYLYANVSLFEYTDSNQIGNVDLGRFLDYHIAVKDAETSEKFLVWVNEEVVNNKSVRLSNITPVAMTEAFVDRIGPNKLQAITNITPGVSGFSAGTAEIIGNNTVKITTNAALLNDAINPTVGFATANVTPAQQVLFGQTYSVSNINIQEGHFTITEPALAGNIDAANLTVRFFGRTQMTSNGHRLSTGDQVKIVAGPYSGQWVVEGAGDNTFMIDTPYVSSAVTTGNIVLPSVEITTNGDHGIAPDYIGKKIAVHNADERYYNRVYKVDTIPSANTLVVTGYPIGDTDAVMTANSCVVNTLDHDVISLNNSNLKIDNITSLEGMIESLNRGFELRRGWMGRPGSFQINIPMLNFPFHKQSGMAPQQIKGSTPYVTNFQGLSKKNLTQTGGIAVNPRANRKRGFNKLKNGSPSLRKVKAARGAISSGASVGGFSSHLNTGVFNPSATSPYSFGFNLGAGMPQKVANRLKNNVASALSGITFPSIKYNQGGAPASSGGTGLTGGSTPLPTIPKISTGSGLGSTNNTGGVVLTGGALTSAAKKPCGALIVKTPPPPPIPPPPPNSKPGAKDDSFTTAFDTAVSGNMLANDVDPDGTTLSLASGSGPGGFKITGGPNHGTLSGVTSSGDFTYTPDAGFSGRDTWAYVADDGTYDPNDKYSRYSNAAKVTVSVGVPNPPPPPAPTIYEKCEYQEQSATTRGLDDNWYYHIPVAGTIKIIIDMDAATDRMTVYQGSSRGSTSSTIGGTSANIRNATQAEKQKLLDNRNVPTTNSRLGLYGTTGQATATYPRDFTRDGSGIKNCGVLELTWDPSRGEHMKIFIEKLSSVYRYVICYPTTTNTGTANSQAQSNPNPGQPNAGVSTGTGAAPNTRTFPQTPIFQPTNFPTVKVQKPSVGVPGRGGGISWHKYGGAGPHFSHNFGGFSLAPMAGYTHIPSIFKKTVKTVTPQNVGRLQPLDAGRYVNVTSQRVTGGRVIPLAAPMPSPIPLVKRAIKGVDIALVPGGSKFGNSKYWGNDLVNNQILKIGADGYSYHPISVPGVDGFGTAGSNFSTDGSRGTTAGVDGFGATTGITSTDGTAGGVIGPGPTTRTITTIAGDDPSIVPGGLIFDSTVGTDPSFSDALMPGSEIPSEDAPLNADIEYTDKPIITVQPTRKIVNPDGTFEYVPIGPEAQIPLYAPGPQIVITENDVAGLNPGDQVIVNNTPITIGGTPAATLKEFECAGGFGYTATPGKSNSGANQVTLDACGNVPLTFRDGCAGGVYKEVLDFHIVKNFSLGDTLIPESNVAHFPGIVSTTGTSPSGYSGGSSSVSTTATAAEGRSTTQAHVVQNIHTGGKGYMVGDRLRVVGGTPVSSPFGRITELCIEIPGMFYSDAANVHVLIGDGTTAGSKAEAGTPVIDAQGQIKSIPLVSGGEGYDPANPPKVRIIDTGTGHEGGAKIPAKVRPIIKSQVLNSGGNFVDAPGALERPAKFVVTAVDSEGVILSVKVIDRGIYKEFPADLSSGIPLEYDHVLLGGGGGLGGTDPVTGAPLSSPGAYDPVAGEYGQYSNIQYDPEFEEVGGYQRAVQQNNGQATFGTGARIFLTAREIPDCSERADVRSKLGLPAQTLDLDTVQHLANQLNNGLQNAGYDPNDINFGVNPINDDLSELQLTSPVFDGVDIGELTPGFLDKLGWPAGSYNNDIGPLSATDGTPVNDTDVGTDAGRRSLIDGDPGNDLLNNTPGGPGSGSGFGGPGSDGGLGGLRGNGVDGFGSGDTGYDLPEEVMVIYGVDIGGFNSDGSSMMGNANVVYVGDLFQYELRALDGSPIIASNNARDCRVLYLESQRYNKEADITNANTTFLSANIPSTKEDFDQVWIDDDGYGKWAYYENGEKVREQLPLVDPKYIKNTIIYDSTTGEKDFDYDMWDPFKGIFPAFVDAEIKYFSEYDPVVYNTRRAVFGPEQVGQVWWNTSSIRYYWYEQGTNKSRWLNWGKSFPGSSIALFEWVESKVPPVEYRGTGSPKNASEFIVERSVDPSTGEYINYYYFWVQNERIVSTQAAKKAGRKFSTFDLAKYLADPIGQGLNTISFISAGTQTSQNIASFVMSNLTKTVREDEQNIQINLSRNLNPIGMKHTSWKLLRENDNNSDVPEDLANKMIDSLAEVDVAGNVVPADNLSEVERYGIKFRPRQTMFKDAKEARRALQYIVNDIMADVKLNTLNTTWQNNMTSMDTVEVVNWYAVKRIDSVTNKKIRYDNTYKAAYTVASVKELDSLSNVPDGTVVMVRASQADRYQLWMFEGKNAKFKQIAIENETLKLKDSVFKNELEPIMQRELREFLYVLKDNILEGTEKFNSIFFELMKYALGEQRELDWAFKTSYVYIEKEEEDLVQRVGYKPDNFESVIEYLNEAKPYTAKVREYKDGKRPPVEYIKDQMLSDFDVPPFADSDIGEVRTLDFSMAPDRDIMSTNPEYAKAYGSYNINQTQWDTENVPVRTGNVNLIFDRVDWRLAETDHNVSAKAYSVSIGDMMANVNAANTGTISNTSTNSYTASSRIFKFDPEVRAQFNIDIDNYFGANSSSNTSIVESGSQLGVAVAAGALNATLTIVKQKVGGTWQGEEFDANVFTRTVAGRDTLELQTAYGYDTTPYDATEGFGDNWDEFINVQNFEGIFRGDSTWREEGITYDGIDGWTFNHLLYGDERPEELVYLSPLENLVMRVRTDPLAFDANNAVVDAISVGPYVADNISTSDSSNIVTVTSAIAAPLLHNGNIITLSGTASTILDGDYAISNLTSSTFTIEKAGITANIISSAGDTSITSGVEAVSVEYIVHQDLFGKTEYLRILTDGSTSTTTAREINSWDTEIDVVDASVLPQPTPGIPAAVWLDGSERIEYNRISGNKLKGITRGTRGTTIPNGPAFVYDGDNAVKSNTFIKHSSGVSVVGASPSDVFDMPDNQGGQAGYLDRDPDRAYWLKTDGTTKSLTDITNRSTLTTIGAFLHGDLVSSIGFDSVAWDSTGWDSI